MIAGGRAGLEPALAGWLYTLRWALSGCKGAVPCALLSAVTHMESKRAPRHAHRYEVGSGLLVAPGVPDIAERQDMQKLIGGWVACMHS